MNNVAIIPARGGSKRIPGKNIRSFLGRPIMAYAIEAALQSGLFERVVVSTDSEEIARVAVDSGAEVPFMRPVELSDDHTGTSEVVLHALKQLISESGPVENACCIYATAPFVTPEVLRGGLEAMEESGSDCAFSVTEFSFPVFRSLRVNDHGRLEMFWPEYMDARSQDLPKAYHDAGQFYWVRAAAFLREKVLYMKDAVPIFLPGRIVQDIDCEEDWLIAELKFKAFMGGQGHGKR